MSSFTRNGRTELGLTPRTRALLNSPKIPFEDNKNMVLCTRLWDGGRLTVHQQYYQTVTKPKLEDKQAARKIMSNSW